jgi:hypothetical protein
MSLRLNPMTGTPVLPWLLVMALCFAPFQGAMSAFAGRCDCPMMMTVEHAGPVAGTVASGSTAKAGCCEGCYDRQACDGACHTAHGVYLMIGFAPLVVANPLQLLNARALAPLVGHSVLPLLHPPQS